MKKKVNRNVNVGDLVIQKKPSRNIEINTGKYPYIGVVYEMKVVHSYDTVFIHWSPENPPDYRPEYGLTRLGIHNLRSTYDVINK